MIDLRTRELPNALVYPGVVVSLASAPLLPADGHLSAVVGGVAACAAFAVVYFLAAPGVIGAALGIPHGLYA